MGLEHFSPDISLQMLELCAGRTAADNLWAPPTFVNRHAVAATDNWRQWRRRTALTDITQTFPLDIPLEQFLLSIASVCKYIIVAYMDIINTKNNNNYDNLYGAVTRPYRFKGALQATTLGRP